MMKVLLSLVGLVMIFTQTANGQILERETNMSQGVQTSNEVILDDIVPREAVKLWKTYFKKYGKVKRNKKKDEYYSTGVKINKINTESNIDVYVRFEEKGADTKMLMWIDLGMDFVNSKDYKTEYLGVADILDDFRVYIKKHVTQKELEVEEKALNKMKKDLAKLEKHNMKLHEMILKYEEKIGIAKEEISGNMVNQDEKKIEIDRQLELLKEIQTRLESIKKY